LALRLFFEFAAKRLKSDPFGQIFSDRAPRFGDAPLSLMRIVNLG
jgi:hypothetical protein